MIDFVWFVLLAIKNDASNKLSSIYNDCGARAILTCREYIKGDCLIHYFLT
jgi:hypothetical protein